MAYEVGSIFQHVVNGQRVQLLVISVSRPLRIISTKLRTATYVLAIITKEMPEFLSSFRVDAYSNDGGQTWQLDEWPWTRVTTDDQRLSSASMAQWHIGYKRDVLMFTQDGGIERASMRVAGRNVSARPEWLVFVYEGSSMGRFFLASQNSRTLDTYTRTWIEASEDDVGLYMLQKGSQSQSRKSLAEFIQHKNVGN